MPPLYSAAALTVAAVYCVWRAYAQARRQRDGLLRRRVAYMLWVLAGRDDEPVLPRRAGDWGCDTWPG
jgi:hypothetical protein